MAKIKLFRKRKPTEFQAEIDDDDLRLVTPHRWSVFTPNGSKTRYARTGINGKTVYLHRMILEAGSGDEIDHIDGDGLNNKKINLRFVSRSTNIKAAHRLPGRFGNLTIEELDAELDDFAQRHRT